MKYIANPNMSIDVVINGPEANAGLNPNLSSIMGVIVPINDEIITTVNNENETINVQNVTDVKTCNKRNE